MKAFFATYQITGTEIEAEVLIVASDWNAAQTFLREHRGDVKILSMVAQRTRVLIAGAFDPLTGDVKTDNT